MLTFRLVDVEKDKQTIIRFFTDTGEELEFNESEYIKYAKQKQVNFPEGFVLLEGDQQAVGELVLRYDSYEGREIGYVSFVYVIPEGRGKGYGNELFQYAEDQFKKRNVFEYHLRVAQSNVRAIKFYEKQGLEIIGEERNSYNQRCWRMGKKM
ncbi:N-acetyltransferase [Bacillus sp. AFS018417]|uniref:GNAT family N-acetyltransferase n=1 Tax=Bacillus sp. AFS018417 TaxID=2033491 RepID=UPI001597147C|nr:GNAT family N-acetyltransferase [Bacillus sp. AFS018417]